MRMVALSAVLAAVSVRTVSIWLSVIALVVACAALWRTEQLGRAVRRAITDQATGIQAVTKRAKSADGDGG